jgi:uncharacterized protein
MHNGFSRLHETPLGRWWEARMLRHLELTEVDIEVPGLGAECLTVAFISDVHVGFFLSQRTLVDLADRVGARQPDLIVFGGDLVVGELSELDLLAPLLSLEAPLGKYAVLGNHEYHPFRLGPHRAGARVAAQAVGGSTALWAELLGPFGIRVLANEGDRLDLGETTLWVAGVDDAHESTAQVGSAMRGRRPDEPSLLLSHNPDVFPRSAKLGFDAQLSGHTHGGQIRFGPWAPVTLSRHGFTSGLYTRDDATMYLGRGVGFSALPIRLCARPEIPIIGLRGSGVAKPTHLK